MVQAANHHRVARLRQRLDVGRGQRLRDHLGNVARAQRRAGHERGHLIQRRDQPVPDLRVLVGRLPQAALGAAFLKGPELIVRPGALQQIPDRRHLRPRILRFDELLLEPHHRPRQLEPQRLQRRVALVLIAVQRLFPQRAAQTLLDRRVGQAVGLLVGQVGIAGAHERDHVLRLPVGRDDAQMQCHKPRQRVAIRAASAFKEHRHLVERRRPPQRVVVGGQIEAGDRRVAPAHFSVHDAAANGRHDQHGLVQRIAPGNQPNAAGRRVPDAGTHAVDLSAQLRQLALLFGRLLQQHSALLDARVRHHAAQPGKRAPNRLERIVISRALVHLERQKQRRVAPSGQRRQRARQRGGNQLEAVCPDARVPQKRRVIQAGKRALQLVLAVHIAPPERLLIGRPDPRQIAQLGPERPARQRLGKRAQPVGRIAGLLKLGDLPRRALGKARSVLRAAIPVQLARQSLEGGVHQHHAAALVNTRLGGPAGLCKHARIEPRGRHHLQPKRAFKGQRRHDFPLGFQRILLGHQHDQRRVAPLVQRGAKLLVKARLQRGGAAGQIAYGHGASPSLYPSDGCLWLL